MKRKIQSARPPGGHPLTRSPELRSRRTPTSLRRRLSEVRNIRSRPEPGGTEPLTETRGLADDDLPIRRIVGSSSSPHVPVGSVSLLTLAPCFWRVGPPSRSTACLSRRRVRWSGGDAVARVFVSYASEDIVLAREVRRWLADDHHEVFLAQDLRGGIAAGEAWRSRLYERLRWPSASG
jgi:hypothetical protein